MNKNSLWKYLVLLVFLVLNNACSSDGTDEPDNPFVVIPTEPEETDFDVENSVYKSYTGLVMAGYQGWFAAEGDGSGRGWNHYTNNACGGFTAYCSSIDMWPDMSEYQIKYATPYRHKDGSIAYLYSPYDETSVDLHFKWMKEHGIDGVHMQRFLSTISTEVGKRHNNKVLQSALKAAKKYGRAISVMYDLSGSKNAERINLLKTDWDELVRTFKLNNNIENPTYLWHNGKPMLSIWGVGFTGRDYTIDDVDKLVDRLKGPEDDKVSIMLGVPYYWRTLERDTENNPALHDLIRKADVIMPWAVGRYSSPQSYNASIVQQDVLWAEANGVDYVPLVFPGFTWGNLKRLPNEFNKIPRLKGEFFWRQVAGAKFGGAKSLYIAMFDEVDEGTAIFKVKRNNEVPVVLGDQGYKFVGIEDDLESDYYLWLTGQAANWFHGDTGYSVSKPVRQ